ncbi:hypothetical protein PV327_003521 [Microctonus hyperodae]|uniref:chymotrypsin n=1 Tax=Microctonus hyperodae TaxID=165561 RepID=A0AA39G5S6_MICHY|nr:hypothetical protein PV327_003521 [Microctonus hyperodae]
MKAIIILFVVVAITQARMIPSTISGRIVNGEDAKPGEIPYQVSLQTLGSFHFCGGSVLNKNYVITAAHCVVNQDVNTMKIVAATTDLTDPKSTHEVEKIIIHEKYDSYDSWRNDIALIKVKTEFVANSVLSFVPLPTPSQEIPAESVAVVSGWGRLWQGGSSPKVLQKTEIFIASQNYCEKKYNEQGYDIHSTHICAHDPVEETGSCHGDSGGPLTVEGKLVGLVSWAMGCAMTDYPTVYTRVPEYLDWIKAHAV